MSGVSREQMDAMKDGIDYLIGNKMNENVRRAMEGDVGDGYANSYERARAGLPGPVADSAAWLGEKIGRACGIDGERTFAKKKK